jgi:hypothetical protein
MSDDTLSRLVTEAIAENLSPLLKWLYGVFASVIIGTAAVVGMVYTLIGDIKEAKRDAIEARESFEKLSPLVLLHDKQLGIYEDRNRKSGGE